MSSEIAVEEYTLPSSLEMNQKLTFKKARSTVHCPIEARRSSDLGCSLEWTFVLSREILELVAPVGYFEGNCCCSFANSMTRLQNLLDDERRLHCANVPSYLM